MPAARLLSPKQVARALAVSESSIKRWCDSGSIPTEYTAGGHRRIAISGLRDFLHATGRRLADPGALGIVSPANVRRPSLSDARARLADALASGDELSAEQIGVELLLAKVDVAEICDSVFAPAMHQIGAGWEAGTVEIYQERRSCGVALRAIAAMQALCHSAREAAPAAIGASTPGDNYSVPNAMAQLVLSDCGWRATSLGEGIPLTSLAEAVQREQPALVWVSCSYLADEARFITDFQRFSDSVNGRSKIVVGGRALTETLRKKLSYTAFCDTMSHLHAFACAVTP